MWMFNERGELLIGTLSPEGFHEISRAKLIEPTTEQLGQRGGVCWSHPAFAYSTSSPATTANWSAPVLPPSDFRLGDGRPRADLFFLPCY